MKNFPLILWACVKKKLVKIFDFLKALNSLQKFPYKIFYLNVSIHEFFLRAITLNDKNLIRIFS